MARDIYLVIVINYDYFSCIYGLTCFPGITYQDILIYNCNHHYKLELNIFIEECFEQCVILF